jgi:2-polyprenyl-3-methyl-5-hydroxy-6-metoxy-1,4-benzoquinol methylase
MEIPKNKILDFYNRFSNKLTKDLIYINRRHIKHFILLWQIFKKYEIENILEIGTGVGIITKFLSYKYNKITSIDISENNIKLVNKYLPSNVSLINKSIMDYNTESKYDLILLLDTLEHIPKSYHTKLFKKLSNIMNNNAHIIFTIPNPCYTKYIINNNPKALQVVDEMIYLDDILEICKETNLQIDEYKHFSIDRRNQYIFYNIVNNNSNFTNLNKSETIEERVIYKLLNNRLVILLRKLYFKKRINGKL